MKEWPFLFHSQMVRAILDGRKTQTRRVVKPSNSTVNGYNVSSDNSLWAGLVWDERIFQDRFPRSRSGQYLHVPWVNPNDGDDDRVFRVRCRYEIGDLIWVKEAYAIREEIWVEDHYEPDGRAIYKADRGTVSDKWKPPIFMPRSLSRITLKITDIRVQRIQDISEEDAIAEGFEAEKLPTWWQGYRAVDMGALGTELMYQQMTGDSPPSWMIEPHRMLDRPDLARTARDEFRTFWNYLAHKGTRWDDNPWTWCFSFKRVERDEPD